MIYRAEIQFTRLLLSLPETGMGYQIIDATRQGFFSSSKSRFVVYNGELIIEKNDFFEKNKRQVINEGFNRVLDSVNSIALVNPHIIKLSEIRESRTFSNARMDSLSRSSDETGARENPLKRGNGTDLFFRLSAYQDDKRIDFQNKKLRDGSFATTNTDYLLCKLSGDDPIDRYALPNDEKIKFAFKFKPQADDLYRKGVVQPAYNHNGGGIEVYFDNGTSNGTLIDTLDY